MRVQVAPIRTRHQFSETRMGLLFRALILIVVIVASIWKLRSMERKD